MTEVTHFEVHSSIPVLRMLDETAAKCFYVDFLGYEIDWEHRFRDDPASPLYMQVHLGESVLHLNGHAEEQSPKCEVRVPVKGLAEYCEHLKVRLKGLHAGGEEPEIVDPRYEGRGTDVNIIDPSGNTLVFWTPRYLAD